MTSPHSHARMAGEPGWRRVLRRIAWLEPFWVAAVGLLLLLPARFLPAAVGQYLTTWRPGLVALLTMGWPLRWVAYRQFTRRTPLDWPLFFILLWLGVNYWASADKALTWQAIGYLAFGIALYLALLNWPPAKERPGYIAAVILLIGLGLALAAPLLSEFVVSKVFRVIRLEALFQRLAARAPGSANLNVVAGALVLTAPLPIALALRWDWTRRRWPPILCGLAAAFVLAMIVLTQSRGAYLAVAVAVALVVALRWPKLLYGLPILLLIGAVALYRIGPRVGLEALFAGGAVNGLDGRLEIWSRALYALQDFVFTGIGIGTFERVIPLLYPYFTVGFDTPIPHAHNLLLQVGVDLGLPGLIAYGALFINVFVMLARALRRREDAFNWALAAGAAGGLTAMFVHGLFDATLWNTRPAFLVWLLVALAVQVGLQAAPPAASDASGGSPALRINAASHDA